MWPFGKNTADRVKDALNAQPKLKDLGLQVTENHGNVTVSGMVPNDRYGNLVRIVAEGINGVKSVDVGGLVAQETTPTPASAPAQVAPGAPTPSISAPSLGTPSIDAELQEAEDNSKIAKAVYSALKNNGELKDDPIDVLQSGKSIILRGVVDNDHEQRLAEQLARAVQGVASVDVSGLKVAAGAKELTKEKDTDTGDTVYTVQSGDTLGEIAQKYYGNAGEYKKIAHYNNISNPDLIKVGQKLRIPS
ncbi:BON domain-containing protein [Deinococcus sp. Arct2-2]|uniref:BON domain-containing protein n=1 Tax=Deinococcus sp. Arct2-2 TaxID=2568653 RepID=UPI0010A30ED3|nr:BON domain-containing protein [Deinococcus sp. Arct2-2]THF68243.1 BON domain-containing protein [Deinococcus sp. Arct2-2]